MRRPWTKQDIVPLTLYLVGIGIVVLAGLCDKRMKDHLDVSMKETRAGLRLVTVANIEAIESFVLRSEASSEERKAHTLEEKAKYYFHKSEEEEQYAERSRSRAEHDAEIAKEDFEKLDQIKSNISHDQAMVDQLLRDISRDEHDEDNLGNELKEIHTGMCENRMFYKLCDVIGGSGDLQRQYDAENIKIHQEIAKKDEIGKQIYMEKLVAAALTGEANEYANTSQELLRTAEYWENRSKEDYMEAVELNTTAEKWEVDAESLEERGERDFMYEVSNISFAQRMFINASNAFNAAMNQAVLASLVAMVALSYFGYQFLHSLFDIFVRLSAWATSLQSSRSNNSVSSGGSLITNYEFWRCASYFIMHIMIFLIAAGLCGDYVLSFRHYNERQRTAIIAWFSFSAALSQTFALHVVPHIMSEWPLNGADTRNIAKHGFLRFIALWTMLAIEFLTVAVAVPTFSSALSSPLLLGFFGNPFTVLCGIFSWILYLYTFEPRRPVPASAGNNSIMTVTSQQDDNTHDEFSHAASEATPLTTSVDEYNPKSTTTSVTRVALLSMDFGLQGRTDNTGDDHSQYTLDSASPYFVDIRREAAYLKVALELLFCCATVHVLTDSLRLACHSHLGKRIIAALIVITSAVLVCFLARRNRAVSDQEKRDKGVCLDDGHHIEIVSV